MFNISQDAIQRLIEAGESENLEFKKGLPSDDIIGKLFVAFANAEGGILLLGITDDGRITGLSRQDADIATQRLRKISESLLPYSANVGMLDIQGKTLVYACIDKAPDQFRPITTSRGEVYRRIGNRYKQENIGEYFLGNGSKTRSIQKPRTGLPTKHTRPVNAFVAMSFRNEEEPALVDYFQAMQRAVKATNLPIELVRIDLEEGDYEISQEIMNKIDQADFVIVDFTLNAGNVYFELGYARGQKRRIIQTARMGTSLDFDVRNWRTIFYRNATELEQKLVSSLLSVYEELNTMES